MRDVTQAFANAPYQNPDGSSGINLHIDAGGLSPVPLGDTATGGQVPWKRDLGSIDASGYDPSEFEAIKVGNFGPGADGFRRDAFHYVVYADRYAESGSSGLSRGVPAADLMVTDGDESWGPDGFSRIQERGTLMHELGHNLSLRLGGPDDTTLQNDPSYESIMNYAYQLGGLPPDQRPDYSVGSPYNDWAHIRFDGGSIGDLGDVAPVTVTFDAAQVPLGQTDLEMVLYSPALGLDVHDAQGSVIGLAIDAAAVQEDLAEATDAAASSTEPPSAEVLTVLENLLVTGSGGQTPPDASTPSKPKTDATGSFGPALVGGAAKAPAGGSSAEGLAGTGNWAANQSTARRLISYRN